MGNQNSSQKKKSSASSSPSHQSTAQSGETSSPTKSQGMIRSPSGADFNDKSHHTKFAPIDELAKILARKNESEGSGSGITDVVFTKYVFPRHPDLGMRLFRHFHALSHAKTQHLGVTAFRQQCERFLSILDDSKIIEMYVRIFCNLNEENASPQGVKGLLKLSFNIAMAHYSGDAQTCPFIDKTLDAVIATCFFQEPLSVGFISRWLEENCPRLILPVHKYCIHLLTTSYRSIKMNTEDKTGNGLELATPVLEKGAPFSDSLPMLTLSMAWLLAGTMAPSYSKPQAVLPPKEDESAPPNATVSPTSALPSQLMLNKLVAAVPSHWTLLYDTRQHGVGANRFLHHVLGYRGPTLVVFHARSFKDQTEKIFCVASPNEWKETNLYTGGEESCLVQLQPKFSVIEHGMKILYLNTHIRGYPKGLRVAVDPRNPIIAVDEHFEKLDVHSIAHDLLNIEVWGCGDKSSRDVQLDIKKWQIKEAERQRTVKLTAADWIDHPDRYLLELGGRPQYNISNN